MTTQQISHSSIELAEMAKAQHDANAVERDRLRGAFRCDALRTAIAVMSAGESPIADDEHDALFALAERIETWVARP